MVVYQQWEWLIAFTDIIYLDMSYLDFLLDKCCFTQEAIKQ